jgi:hypothetical protein
MLATLAAAALGLAIVTQDQTALRAAPAGATTTQAVLWPGDLLEVRGERLDHLQVYDHQRERAGYVKATQVRPLALQESDAPSLLAVLRFLRDTPGAEPLGIAYAAAYLKAAPAAAITAEPFDALGVMSERLARRASARGGRPGDTVAAHLEAAGRYGVKFNSIEREGALQLCYEGEAFRRVLAMPAEPEALARAALALTRHDCVDPQLPPHRRQPLDLWRAEVLDRVDAAAFARLAEPSRNRLRLRRAGVWAALAHARSRDGGDAAAAARRAIAELAAVNKTELGDEEQAEYADAAIRTGASRSAAATAPASRSALGVLLQPGEPGQTCLLLIDAAHGAQVQLLRRCTYATVWPGSVRFAPDGRSVALAVQPLPAWTELWLLRATAEGWQLQVLPPAASEPTLGYIEFAGWVPGGQKLLVAREARSEGRLRRSFEVLSLDTLAPEKQASSPQWLALFAKWQDPLWKSQTVSLR